MHSEIELRDRLADFAESMTPAEGFEAGVWRRARRIKTRRRAASLSAGVLVLAAMLTLFRVDGLSTAPRVAAPPPDGPFLGWGIVDDSASRGLIDEAAKAWDDGSRVPHTGIRPLAATRDFYLGSVVVLQGFNKDGRARLAFFTSDSSGGGVLRLRADRPAPDPSTTKAISLVSPRLSSGPGQASSDYWGTYAIALAMPGVTGLQVSSTTIDDQMRGKDGPQTGRFVVQQLPLSSTAQTTSIAGFAKSKRLFTQAGEDGAIGDAQSVHAVVIHRGGQQLTVSVDDGEVPQRSQFAVSPAGLVGVVTAVDTRRSEATIDLVTSAAFSQQAHTDISNVSGSVRGVGGELLMEQIANGPDVEINQGNRVVVPDPAQRSNNVGAVTIGRATKTKPAAASEVELTPTVDFAQLKEIWIMTPYSDGAR